MRWLVCDANHEMNSIVGGGLRSGLIIAIMAAFS
jgi:hypothetical protein